MFPKLNFIPYQLVQPKYIVLATKPVQATLETIGLDFQVFRMFQLFRGVLGRIEISGRNR